MILQMNTTGIRAKFPVAAVSSATIAVGVFAIIIAGVLAMCVYKILRHRKHKAAL